MLKRKVIYFLFCSVFLSSFMIENAIAKNRQESELELYINENIDVKFAQIIARTELREKLIEEGLNSPDIKKIVKLANFDEDAAKALVAMSLDLKFHDKIKASSYYTAKAGSTEYVYKAEADFAVSETLILNMQNNLAKNLLIYRLIQVQKDLEDNFSSIAVSLPIAQGKTKASTEDQIFAIIEKKTEILDGLFYLFDELSHAQGNNDKTWNNPDIILEKLNSLEKMPSAPVSVLNTLAEIYLYIGRPQKALELLEKAYKKENYANLFTDYLNILIALSRNEITLAQNDIKKAKEKLADNETKNSHFILPYFLVLEGATAQMTENFSLMCKAYEEACFYNNCAPYFAVQDICSKTKELEN